MSVPFSRRQALARFGALLAGSPLLRAQQQPPPGDLANTLEFETIAERKLNRAAYAEITGSNRKGFDRITFRPHLLVNVQQLDLSLELFGETLFAPILAGPASHQKRFYPEGEVAAARGASAAKAMTVVADRSDAPLEEIAAQAGASFWYQIYPEQDASAVAGRIRSAVQAGCKAVCLTVGAPLQPNQVLDWDYVDRIRQQTSVPLLLKGVMNLQEATLAAERGVQGIVVSNHGGRFVEGLAEPIAALPVIAEAVGGSIPVLIDGGFRRGSDVLKALALGATAVLVTRPVLWGLAAYGDAGVQTVLEMLQTELASDMAMCGAANLASIKRDFVKVHGR